MANDPFKPKPLVSANVLTEFGGVEMTPEFMNEGPAQRDYLYVPGPSDRRYERDIALSALHRGEIKANEVPTLEHNVRWFRIVSGAGSDPDMKRTVTAKTQGYRPVLWDEIGEGRVITDYPPGAMKAPDGTVRLAGGDQALFICDRANAARNAMRKKIRTEDSVDGMEFKVDENGAGLGTVGKQLRGADPYVQRTIGTEPREATK